MASNPSSSSTPTFLRRLFGQTPQLAAALEARQLSIVVTTQARWEDPQELQVTLGALSQVFAAYKDITESEDVIKGPQGAYKVLPSITLFEAARLYLQNKLGVLEATSRLVIAPTEATLFLTPDEFREWLIPHIEGLEDTVRQLRLESQRLQEELLTTNKWQFLLDKVSQTVG